MDRSRFEYLTGQYSGLRIAVLGDFCLDRYLEIDPARQETSIETGLPVYNVVNVRAQPGGAGTILNNLSALGIGTIYPIGFAGVDGEGYELWTALEKVPGVSLNCFLRTPGRRTFTYCKPLVVHSGQAPQELNRLDSKNWDPTPASIQQDIAAKLRQVIDEIDALIVLEQVDVPETGVITRKVLASLKDLVEAKGGSATSLPILADSRRGLRGYPPAIFKMNAAELATLTGSAKDMSPDATKTAALKLAAQNGRSVFVTLAERGIVGATPSGEGEHIPALPVRGEIDVVGAGDAVSANLAAALAAGAPLREVLEIANAAASVVLHKLGTTGAASVAEIRTCLRL
jgi:rfaE bifunctional protein kinase chain/domain